MCGVQNFRSETCVHLLQTPTLKRGQRNQRAYEREGTGKAVVESKVQVKEHKGG